MNAETMEDKQSLRDYFCPFPIFETQQKSPGQEFLTDRENTKSDESYSESKCTNIIMIFYKNLIKILIFYLKNVKAMLYSLQPMKIEEC